MGWIGLDLRVGGGIEHLTVLIRVVVVIQIVTNTVENEFERCFHQSIITLVAEVGWAANANAGINKYS